MSRKAATSRAAVPRRCAIQNKDHARSGFVLPMAIFLFSIAFAMAVAFSTAVNRELEIASRQGFANQAFYVAESGIEWSWWQIYANRPQTHTFTGNLAWSPVTGSYSSGDYSLAVAASETAARAARTFGDVNIRSTATFAGFGQLESYTFKHLLTAVLENLANDDDANPLTAPIATASSQASAAAAASYGNDGDVSTSWTANTRTGEWFSIALGSRTALRKAQIAYPDARVTSHTLQTTTGGAWKAVANPAETVNSSNPGQRVVSVVFDEVEATAIRILFTAATAAPSIHEIKLFGPAWKSSMVEGN